MDNSPSIPLEVEEEESGGGGGGEGEGGEVISTHVHCLHKACNIINTCNEIKL